MLVASAVAVALALSGLVAAVVLSNGSGSVALLGARSQMLPVVRYSTTTSSPMNTAITVHPPMYNPVPMGSTISPADVAANAYAPRPPPLNPVSLTQLSWYQAQLLQSLPGRQTHLFWRAETSVGPSGC